MPENSITRNLEKIQPVVWMLIFFLLPLERYVAIGSGKYRVWNISHIALAAAVVVLWVWHYGTGRRNLAGIKTALVLSAALVVINILGQRTVESLQTMLMFLSIIWLGPPLTFFIRQNRSLVVYLLVVNLSFHALWAIAQFSLQSDLALHFIGEPTLTIGQPGVATFSTTPGVKLVRSYGPYPHPNVLAGSIVLVLIVSTHYSSRKFSEKKVAPLFILNYFLGLALLLTFSRTAWLAALILFFVAYMTPTKLVRGLPLLITCIVCAPLILSRSPQIHEAALVDRTEGIREATALLQQLPLWYGVGPGNYEHVLRGYLDSNGILYESWHIAPVHNVPLLLLTEWGVIPTVFIGLFFVYSFGSTFRRTWPWLLPLIPLAWFDHYLLTQAAPLVYMMAVLLFVSDQKSPTVDQPPITPTPRVQQ